MPVTPMLGDIELQQVQQIQTDGDDILFQHAVPALEGDFLQELGRRSTRLTLQGVLVGSDARDNVDKLRTSFRAAEPVSFVADIATATKVDRVLIEELGVRELAGKPERFEYALTLREYTPAPATRQEPPPPPPPPPPPSVNTGTLVIEVTVEGQPSFDFSTVTVSLQGTQDDGTALSRTLTSRQGNVWTDQSVPPGQYSVQAMEANPQRLSGAADAASQPGQTTRVSITLNPVSTIAKTFIAHFRFNKAFVEPCIRPVLQQVAQYAKDHPAEKLVIVGHTDKTGSAQYNQSLSERRARSIFAYLTFGSDAGTQASALAEWNALRAARPASEVRTVKDNWGIREYQHILQDLGFYPGVVDGQDGPLTQSAVRAFRCQNGLPPGATVDDPTWTALITAYMAQDKLNVPSSQFLPNCGGEILKWLGCGEEDPVKNVPTAWRPNRRTEMLFVQADRLPCQVPQPDTFDLPQPEAVNKAWCLGPVNAARHCCFVTPATDACTAGAQDKWCRQPAEPGSITVQGTIQRQRPDGSLVPAANQKFVLITRDGEFKAGEQSSGEPQAARTAADGTFSIADQRIGVYSLEVVAPVLVRLADQTDKEIKGNAVCKALRASTDRLDVVIVNAPVQREIRLPLVVHLMRVLQLESHELRTCADASLPGGRRPQVTSLFAQDDSAVQALFDEVNTIWRQARIRFNVENIVREAYARPPRGPVPDECGVDEDEFKVVLKRCAYPGATNVFFFGSLAGTTEVGFGVATEDSFELGVGGCGVGDRALGADLDPSQRAQTVAHELGHFLHLQHVDADATTSDRLMLSGTLTGANRTLVQAEVDTARSSKGAGLECAPLSLRVAGAIQVGGTLSPQFMAFPSPFDTVTVDAVISDALLQVGTLVMTGGDPGATDRQRVVDLSALPDPSKSSVTEIKATYTPNSGGDAMTTSVFIRVVLFGLRVDGAERLAPTSNRFIACPDPNGVVTVVAQIGSHTDPPPFCVPIDLVIWTNGDEKPDPLRRTVSTASVAPVEVKARIGSIEDSVIIEIKEVLLTSNTAPFTTGVERVQIEGLVNQQLTAPDKRIAQANLFAAQTASFFRARACVSGVAGATVTAVLISNGPDSVEIERLNLTLTRTTGNFFVSEPLLAVPSALLRSDMDKLTFVDFKVIRARAGGKIRLQRTAAATNPSSFSEVTVRGRVVFANAQAFTTSGVKVADIRRQLQRANQLWAQAGIEVRERAVADTVAAPAGLDDIDMVEPFNGTLSAKERQLVGLSPNGPSRSAVVNDMNIYYVRSITGPAAGVAYTGEGFTGIHDPNNTAIALEGPVITDLALSHEFGHHFLRAWGGNEHRDQATPPKAWPEANIMHAEDTGKAVAIDRTQAENIVAGTSSGHHPCIIFVP